MRAWHTHALGWLRSHGLQGLAFPSGGGPSGGRGEGVAAQDVVRVGVLGLSGVGKSSLLNALLTPGMQLLPAGGVGPLTGGVVRLVPREEMLFRATYQPRAWVHDLLEKVRLNAPEESPHFAHFSSSGLRAVDPVWLARVLQHVLEPAKAPLPECSAATAEAAALLAAALDSPAPVAVLRRSEQPAKFHRLVRSHVAGELTPFCTDLKIGCSSSLLGEGIELMDLPGLGTFGDGSASQALKALEHLRGVVLVLDRSGVPDVVMTALSRSGFLRRWIAGEASGVIAVTKLDEIANSARGAATIRRCWSEHLEDAMGEAREVIYQQVRCAFAAAGGAEAQQLLAEPERIVFPVTSYELEALHRADGTARVRLAESTGIPGLRRAVLAVARSQAVRWAPAVTRSLRYPSAARSLGRELYAEWLNLLDEVCT